jgi:hypothetical protein
MISYVEYETIDFIEAEQWLPEAEESREERGVEKIDQ